VCTGVRRKTPFGFWALPHVLDEKPSRSGGPSEARRQRGVLAAGQHVPRQRRTGPGARFGQGKGELLFGTPARR
jgi:hypothetical protein